MTATALGQTLIDNLETLEKFAGVAIIAMGVFFVLALFVPLLNREWHPDALMERAGRGGPVVVGRRLRDRLDALRRARRSARSSGSPRPRHGRRRAARCWPSTRPGWRVPFLLTAIAFNRATTAFAWVKRHYAIINGVAGVLLIAIGVLVVSGELFRLNIEAQKFLDGWTSTSSRTCELHAWLHLLGRLDPEQVERRARSPPRVATQTQTRSSSSSRGSAPTTRQSR